MNLINELECEKSYGDHMAAMAQHWMERAQTAERMVFVLVHAAGGEIRVHAGFLIDKPKLVLERTEDVRTMETVFKTRLADGA